MRRVKIVEIRNAEFVQKRRRRRMDSGIGTGDAVAAFFQHASERRHGRAGNSDDVDMFLRTHGMTVVSKNSKVPDPSATSLARMPSGMVNMGRGVWPTAAPKTMGTPSGFRIRSHTSFALGLPATGGSQSGNSPSTIAFTPRNFPACVRCISARSICQGFMPRSSRRRMLPAVSSSQGVARAVSIRVRQQPNTTPLVRPRYSNRSALRQNPGSAIPLKQRNNPEIHEQTWLRAKNLGSATHRDHVRCDFLPRVRLTQRRRRGHLWQALAALLRRTNPYVPLVSCTRSSSRRPLARQDFKRESKRTKFGHDLFFLPFAEIGVKLEYVLSFGQRDAQVIEREFQLAEKLTNFGQEPRCVFSRHSKEDISETQLENPLHLY